MRGIRGGAGALLLWSIGSALALGQNEGHAGPPPAGAETAMDDRVRAALAEVERISGRLENARQTNDPAKMRAAMDDLQNALAVIRAHLLAVISPETSDRGTMAPGPPPTMDHSKMSMPGMNPTPKKSRTESGPSSKTDVEQHPAPAETRDPVCGNEVETKCAEKATDEGKPYDFCSRADKERFLADPDRYVKR